MDSGNIPALIIAIISAFAAIATNRSANKASTRNAEIESRTTVETEAYNRARKFDTDTIERQDTEIEELRKLNVNLEEEVKELRRANSQLSNLVLENNTLKDEVTQLKRRIRRLEGIPEENDGTEEPVSG